LKQETPESDRLKGSEEIKEIHLSTQIQSKPYVPTLTTQRSRLDAETPACGIVQSAINTQTFTPCQQYTPGLAMAEESWKHGLKHFPHCLDCGLVFMTPTDVTNHRKRTRCVEEDDSDVEEPSKKKILLHDVRENKTLLEMRNKIYNYFDKEFNRLVSKYQDRGLGEKESIEKAKLKLLPEVKARFLRQYGQLLYQIIDLQKLDIHDTITEVVESLVNNGFSFDRAIQKAMSRFSRLADELFDHDEDYTKEGSNNDDGSTYNSDDASENEDGTDDADDNANTA
ncbi:unnamed protein product, partial [Owenia fusiformis]